MKKGFCIVLATLLAVTSLAACNKKNSSDTDSTTYTNADGSAYVEVTDKKGESVTDKEGETVTSVLSEDEVSKIEKEKSKSEKKNNGTTVKTASSEQASKLESSLEAITGGSDIEMTAAPENTLPQGTTVKETSKNTLRDTVIVKAIKDKKFTLTTNIVSGSTKIPATVAFDGDNLCMDITYNGVNMRLMMLDGKTYLVFPLMKMYYDAGDSEDTLDSFSDLGSEQKYVGTSTVTDDKTGTKYTCEEYSADGVTFKYYFDKNDNWKRWESVSEDGTANVFEVSSFTNKVDSKLFSLKGYTKLDESAFGALAQ